MEGETVGQDWATPIESLQKRRRETTPFFYCRWVTAYPKSAFFTCLGLHVAVVIASGVLFAVGYNLFPTNFDSLPMELYSVPYRLRDFAFRDKDKFPDKFWRSVSVTRRPSWERSVSYTYSAIDTFYDTDSGNVFTKENLQRIESIEGAIAGIHGYEKYCLTVNSSLVCKKPVSVLRYFDGTFVDISPVFYDPDFNHITAVLYEAYTNNVTRSKFKYFLPKSFTITPEVAIGAITRSIITFGCTSSNINGVLSHCNDFKDFVEPFLMNTVSAKLKEIRKDASEHLEFYYMSFQIWRKEVIRQAMHDLLYAIGSMLFIFVFMGFQTRSLWITCFAVLSILWSFLGANLIYRCVVGFEYFGFFHILAIFIILGIGADNLFVFCDIWKLTAMEDYPSLTHRLSDAYSRSARSMFITSLTTTVAFVCSAVSPLLATRSFGVFAGILVMYNYLSVIIFFPTVVVVYHLYFEKCIWPCCRCCNKTQEDDEVTSYHVIGETKDNGRISREKNNDREVGVTEDNAHDASTSNVISSNNVLSGTVNQAYSPERYVTTICVSGHQGNGISSRGLTDKNVNQGFSMQSMFQPPTKSTKTDNGDISEENDKIKSETLNVVLPSKDLAKSAKRNPNHRQRAMVVFFRDYYFRFITHNIARFILIPMFIGVVVFLGYQASQLEPDNENMQIYKSSHNYARADQAERYKFLYSPVQNLVPIYIVWGLRTNDRSSCNFSSINCHGVNQYDDNFDPNPVANQRALLEFCDTLYNLSSADIDSFRIARDPESGELSISCFPTKLQKFLTDKGNQMNMSLSLPWDSSVLQTFMSANPRQYGTTYNSSYPNILEIPVQNWLYNGYYNNITQDYLDFDSMIGEQKDEWSRQLVSSSDIYFGNKIKYLVIRVNTTINRFTTGYGEGLPIMQKWEDFISSQMRKMPPGLQGGFQLTRNTWHWLNVQKVMADNAILGIVIGISLTFIIITLSTMNIVIGLFATVSIGCTTVGVIGVIPLAGWKLGILVSLNMCMLVGLAVDYVVHLAEGYHTSLHSDRLNRTRDMLEAMGMPVFSGACTTLGASLFMLFADIQFFMQFGIFLFCTIGFSLLFSLGLFTMIVGMFGPQNNTGDLMKIIQMCRRTT